MHHNRSGYEGVGFPSRILLVEDVSGDANLVISALHTPENHFEVFWVQTFLAAVAEVAERTYECVLVDLGLPDADGLIVVETLSKATPNSAIVVLTGRVDEVLALDAVQHGADDYFLKSELSARGLHRSINHAIERSRTRAALEHLTLHTSAVMSTLGDGVVVVDEVGLVLSVNPAAERIFGATEEQLLGVPISAVPWSSMHRDGTPVAESEMVGNMATSSDVSLRDVVRAVKRADGEVSWVEVSAHRLHDADERLDGVVVSMRDVSERIVAAETARFQAALLGAVGQAVIATDPKGRIAYWNKAAEDMYGWSEADAFEKPATELIRASPAEQISKLKKAVAAGVSWSGDLQLLRHDGTMPILVSLTPMLDEQDELLAIIAVSTDISERKRAEEEAKALSAIVESTADAVYTVDLSGTVLTWNQGAQDLYGYRAEEAIGLDIRVLGPDGHENEFRSQLALIEAGERIRGLQTVRRRRDGTFVDVSLTSSPIYGEDGNIAGASSIVRDISDLRRFEEELTRQATHDNLTGLPNRTLVGDRLAQALLGAAYRNIAVAVLFLDLDQFKTVNDGRGHLVGDELLFKVAERLTNVMRPNDTVARFGGDEFVIVCDDTDLSGAKRIAERIGLALREPIEVGGKWQYVSASIGIAVSPPLEADPDALLRYADTAMYDAKARGRARFRVFDASLAMEAKSRLELANDLADAIREDALEVHYQPVVELATGQLVGLEALTRWRHSVRGWIPPDLFVPMAEESGLIVNLDRWVLERACQDGAEFRASGVLPPEALLAVNISAHNAGNPDLIDIIRKAATDARFPLSSLELEVTETAIMGEVPEIRQVLSDVRQLGIGIALDDFGTGYSSLTFVRQLPVTSIKIDLSFTKHIADRHDDRAITASVIDLARAVGLRTIAEGVETAEQLSVLHRLGCHAGQGYLWSKALSPDELTSLVHRQNQRFLSAASSPLPRPLSRPGAGRLSRRRGAE